MIQIRVIGNSVVVALSWKGRLHQDVIVYGSAIRGGQFLERLHHDYVAHAVSAYADRVIWIPLPKIIEIGGDARS